MASALDHPNIVSIHQRGEFEGQLWIAMQFVDGTDANAALRAGTMTPARAVVAFPTAAEAKKLLAAQESQWTSCSGRTLTLAFPTPPTPQLWTAGTPADADGALTMTQTMKDGGGMQCQRALAARNNVAIDISACRFDIASQAVDILNHIAAKIPQ